MAADIEALLSHANFLRSLSRALVADRELADDLVQETWVSAVKQPPGRGVEARPWLARALRKRVASFFRREGRGQRREESVARSEAVPSGERDSLSSELSDVSDRIAALEKATVDARSREETLKSELQDRNAELGDPGRLQCSAPAAPWHSRARHYWHGQRLTPCSGGGRRSSRNCRHLGRRK